MQAGSTFDPSATEFDVHVGPEDPGKVARRRAQALSLEFSAPVGLLGVDPDGSPAWSAQVGTEAVRWPGASRASRAAVESVVDAGGATLWLPGPASDHIWLILRLPSAPDRREVPMPTAWAGFTLPGVGRGSGRTWGPCIPPQALTAWGREVASRLRSGWDASPSARSGEPSPSGGRRRVRMPDRLTRDFHVSDPPERFQRLAVESLRDALGVEAVAWVPRNRREPVVLAGGVASMGAEAFRLLLPDRPGSDECRWGDAPADGAVGVRDALAVASNPEGCAGWLVAVNPIDGRPFGPDEADVLRPVASLIATQRANARHFAELKELLFGVIRSLTSAIDAKDPYTLGHSERVGRIAVQLGEALGLSANERGDLYLCGLLHDVGKIGVSDAILQKPGPLTPEEFDEIKRHVKIGVQILSDLKKLNHLLPGVAHHHENFDGTGYPDGLAGLEIPRIARILAVADAFDAMSSTRPYRSKLAPEKIDRIFREGAGSQWDPEVVDALFACRQQVERIRQKGLGDSVMQVVDHTIDRGQGASAVAG